MTESGIFKAAVRLPKTQRLQYLEQACVNNPDLRREVESLLRAHDEPGGLLSLMPADGTIDAVAPIEAPGHIIGPYKLLQKIGEGGFGVVYMAEQEKPLRRMVALKIIKPGMDTAQVIARFESERQALALMDHPNIAQVFDAGATESGRPYFVMELVKGVSITEFCDLNHMPAQERIRLFLDVCHAIQHAHHKGVIHRDIKPSNVMVTLHDGVPVVKVIDFGVAKATAQKLTEKTLFTAYGQMIGTPAYMSPEQAEMSGLDIDTRSDVYSLGVLLYELLTGTTPLDVQRLRQAGYAEMQRLIREEEPPRPSTRLSSLGNSATILAGNRGTDVRKLCQLLAGDLDWIAMKALEKDRTRRYDSPGNFAADLERYRRREPIQARPPSALYKLKKLVQRNRLGVLAVTSVAAALVIGAGVAIWQAMVARQAQRIAVVAAEAERQIREQAQAERNRAVEAEHEAREAAGREEQERKKVAVALNKERFTSYVHRLSLAQREWQADEVRRARELLEECPPELRQWEWRYLRRLCNPEAVSFRQHSGPVRSVSFSPDGTRIASASTGGLFVWDAATGQAVSRPVVQGVPGGLEFSHDGKFLAVSLLTKSVAIVDSTHGAWLRTVETDDQLINAMALSPDGKRVATAGERISGQVPRGDVRVFDAATGEQVFQHDDLPHAGLSIAYSPNGKLIAVCTGDLNIVAGGEASNSNRGQVRVYDADTGKLLHTFKENAFWVTDIAFSPDSRRVISAGADSTVRIFDVVDGREVVALPGHNGWVRTVAFSPKGDRFASAGDDRLIRIWDAVTAQELRQIRGHETTIAALAFSPDGSRLVSAAEGRTGDVRVWDLNIDQPARSFREHRMPIKALAFSPDSKWLASVSSTTFNGEMIVREVATGQVRRSVQHEFGFQGVAFSPNGTLLGAAGGKGISIWVVAANGEPRLLPHNYKQIAGGSGWATKSLAFSLDGTRIASAGTSGVHVWNPVTGQAIKSFFAHPFFDNAGCEKRIAFSPNGRRFATATPGATGTGLVNGVEQRKQVPPGVKIFDTETYAELLNLKDGGFGLAFSPDGNRIASGSEGLVNVWDANTGVVLVTLKGHSGVVTCLAFSPDGQRIATGSQDQTVKVWDVATGQEVLTLRGHRESVVSVAFSPDGRHLASASSEFDKPDEIKLWDAKPR